MLPVIFCPDCQSYLGSQAANCSKCGRARLPSETLPQPGHSLWEQDLGSAVHSAWVSGDLVIFNTGVSGTQGGIHALDRLTGEARWSCSTRHSVEAGLAVFGEYLYLATCGFLGGGAELFCLEMKTGLEVWKQELKAGVWSRPLVIESRIYIGQDDGQVRCFDSRNGKDLCYQPVPLPHGRLWLERVDGQLLALSSSGQVLTLHPNGLQPAWHTPLKVADKITSPPCVSGGKVYFGVEEGKLLALDVRARKVSLFAQGLKGVVGTPACEEGRLFVGAQDHYLHAFELESGQQLWQSEKFPHALSTSPFACGGLVVAGVNYFGLVMLEASSGNPAWKFKAEAEARLLSHPILHDGVIYGGTYTGRVFALPWHLGEYGWAAAFRQAQNAHEEAGKLFVLEAQIIRDRGMDFDCYDQAILCWQKAKRMELGGRLWEGLLEGKKAAEAYTQAGQHWIGRDPRQAAGFYDLAAQLYWKLKDKEAMETCARKVQQLARGPLLRLSTWNNPEMNQGEKGEITFRLENVGEGEAIDLALNLGGSLDKPVTYQLLDPLPARADYYCDVTLTILPTKLENDLVIQAEYRAHGADRLFFSTAPAVVKARKTDVIVDIVDTVALKGISFKNPLGQSMRVKIRLSVIGPIKFDVPGTPESPAPLDFTWPERSSGLSAAELDLVQVQEVQDEITVPAAHWAIFLGDEVVVGTVPPGHYTRKKFPLLQPKFTDRRIPAWKAVLFSRSPFRLAYRLGPFRTREGVQVGVECGVTAQLEDDHPFETWKGIMGAGPKLTTIDLASWLEQEVSGTLQKWVAAQPEEALTAGFCQRDELMLSLEQELKHTHARFGVALLDPLYLLNFVNPERERQDGKRAEMYWGQKDDGEAPGSSPRCSHCGASLPADARHCDACGEKLE